MQTLDYQPREDIRRKWLSARNIILICMCAASLAASGWVYISRQQATKVSALTPVAPVVDARMEATTFIPDSPRRWSSYAQMHEKIVNRFVNSQGFGDARLFEDLCWTYNSTLEVKGKSYWVDAVQLISLNDGDEPFVYQRDDGKSPSKKELKNFKHAPLDEMQATALKELQAGKEVAQTGSGTNLRLVGALRATTQCRKCHDVEEGDLMGAFNYPLVAVDSKP